MNIEEPSGSTLVEQVMRVEKVDLLAE